MTRTENTAGNQLISLTAPRQKIDISIVGYQYPNESGGYDDNWLIVEISAEHSGQSWQKCDAAIVAEDLRTIEDWFTAVRQSKAPLMNPQGFWEQNLAFTSFGYLPSGEAQIGIHLDFDFLPPGKRDEGQLVLRFTVPKDEMLAIATSAAECALLFPERYDTSN
jgi:hypothetical protein